MRLPENIIANSQNIFTKRYYRASHFAVITDAMQQKLFNAGSVGFLCAQNRITRWTVL